MVNVTEAKSKQSNDGVDVSYVHSNTQDASDFRSQSIVAQETVISTPDVITFTINDAGHYRMEIILVNGDQYYGDFQVMN